MYSQSSEASNADEETTSEADKLIEEAEEPEGDVVGDLTNH